MNARAEWPVVMMAIAVAAATRSKDATTRVGAVVVSPEWNVVGTGFNGFPRGAPDDKLPTGGKERHLWVIHAEENALLRAVAATGFTTLTGHRLFSTHRPCARCLRFAAHLGVKDVTYQVDELSREQFCDAHEVAETLEMTILKAESNA